MPTLISDTLSAMTTSTASVISDWVTNYWAYVVGILAVIGFAILLKRMFFATTR